MVSAQATSRSLAEPAPAQRGMRAVDVIGPVLLGAAGTLAVGFSPALVGVLWLAAVTPALVRIDCREHRLPNALVVPGYAAAVVMICVAWMVSGMVPLVSVLAGAVYFAFLLLLNLIGGMGMGDVKLGGVLGLVLGAASIDAAVVGPLIAFLAGGIAAMVLLLIRRRRGTRMPFGPFLLLGFWGAVLIHGLSAL